MNPNPSLRFGCLFMRKKSIKKQIFKKKEKAWMEDGDGAKGPPRSPILRSKRFLLFLKYQRFLNVFPLENKRSKS
jgi:hypothetical protein